MESPEHKPSDSPASVLCVVIHWGRIADTEACVRSLLTQTGIAFRAIILDNGTGDNLDFLATEGRSQVIRLTQNTGFTGGVNQAMSLARSAGVAWCWILNNDTVLESPDTLVRLMAYAASSTATVVSPTLRNVVMGQSHDSAWSLFFPSLSLTLADDGGRVAGTLKRVARYHRFISGTAWLVRVSDAPDPLLDQTFFAYFEDVDLALRLGDHRLAVAREVRLTHYTSASTGGRLIKFRYKAANIVYLMHKHGLAGAAFGWCYALLFVPVEMRKYLHCPFSFLRAAYTAWHDGCKKCK